jgi:hypothetical protein
MQLSAFRKWLCPWYLALLPLAPLSAADLQSPSEQNDVIRQLLQRIEVLEKRVADLEGQKIGPAPQAPPSLPPSTAQLPPNQPNPHEHEAPPPTEDMATGPRMKISGFSDINFAASTARGSHPGFSEGQFILHVVSALSPKVSYFGELSLTARSDAGLGTPPATGFNAEVERSIIRYDYSDYLKASFGRYHTPVNYWNTAFHHGSWLQTTISRPEMVQFGGSFIPVHFVGALAEGAASAGGLNLNYNSGLGNGRGEVISRGGDFGDINNNKAWLFNGFIRPDRLYNLQLGASVYRDKVTPSGLPATREWIHSAHLVWTKETPELIAEFANVSHRQVGATRASNSQAWYVQTAYRLPFQDRRWKPYYRFEYIHIPRSDRLFSAIPGLAGSTAGVRYDLTGFSALKLEYRHFRRPVQGIHFNAVVMQSSFTF